MVVDGMSMKIWNLGLVLLGVIVACSSHAQDAAVSQTERIAECDEYAQEYRRCTFLAAGDEIADKRAKALMDSLLASASSDASTQDALRRRCHDGARQLRQSCR